MDINYFYASNQHVSFFYISFHIITLVKSLFRYDSIM